MDKIQDGNYSGVRRAMRVAVVPSALGVATIKINWYVHKAMNTGSVFHFVTVSCGHHRPLHQTSLGLQNTGYLRLSLLYRRLDFVVTAEVEREVVIFHFFQHLPWSHHNSGSGLETSKGYRREEMK